MHAVVTGIAGFIGSRLAGALLREGHYVHGIDRLSDYYDIERKHANLAAVGDPARFTFAELDLCQLEPADLPWDVDVVFHLAAQPGVRGSWGDAFHQYVQDNVLATQRLLECLARMPVPPRMVYSSSSSVYGSAESYPTSTAVTPHPLSPYGVTKLAGECLVHSYATCQRVPAVSLRYFTVYGPGQRPDMAIHKLIDAAFTGRPFRILGDGHQVRDFTYVDDVVWANVLAASAALPSVHEVLNVAGGAEISLLDLIATVERVVGRRIVVDRSQPMPGDPARTSGEVSRTAAILGWLPTHTLAEGIAAQAAWQVDLARDLVPTMP
jgi:UDP-glucuronate 4-epimerase